MESLDLLMNEGKNGVRRVASLELGGKRMRKEISTAATVLSERSSVSSSCLAVHEPYLAVHVSRFRSLSMGLAHLLAVPSMAGSLGQSWGIIVRRRDARAASREQLSYYPVTCKPTILLLLPSCLMLIPHPHHPPISSQFSTLP
jgi:hypothetical protein